MEKFQAQLDWWKKDFPTGKPPKPKAKKKNGDRDEVTLSAPPAPPAAEPEAMPREARAGFTRAAQPTTGADAEKKSAEAQTPAGASITLKRWDPQTPYAVERAKRGR